MDYLRQMQNSFAGKLSLQQALRDLTNFVPGSLNLDWRPQALLGHQLRRALEQAQQIMETLPYPAVSALLPADEVARAVYASYHTFSFVDPDGYTITVHGAP